MTDERIRAGGNDEYVHVHELKPGERVRLRGDIVAEVVDNPNDGTWIIVRHVDPPSEETEIVMVDQVIAKA